MATGGSPTRWPSATRGGGTRCHWRARSYTVYSPNSGRRRRLPVAWLEKDPLKAYRDIIRVGGLLNTYRPPGQTSWSKALVRHGAEPRMALAEVLGVSPED